jgi:hypothetical protein
VIGVGDHRPDRVRRRPDHLVIHCRMVNCPVI